jgi:undecaprenyl-diphosphatase
LLGLLQGVTEFLPVSSSGHLVLLQSFLKDFKEHPLAFDAALHLGTLIAVCAYFWKDFMEIAAAALNHPIANSKINLKQSWSLIIGVTVATIPAAIAGVLWEDRVEKAFSSPALVSLFLILTGCILLTGEWLSSIFKSQITEPDSGFQIKNYLIVGLTQVISLLPGVSRSGSTMAAGIAVGWSRKSAARFSFFMMVPVVAGAALLKFREMASAIASGQLRPATLCAGVLTAALAGYLAIRFLLALLNKWKFHVFSAYCFAIGSISFIFYLVK